ncbi:MAG: hypothetical protein J6S18_01740, partial [Oscillospiraceae bacterium]|nr:hypothetical protein [Oscillospiraceae bacterium]
MKNEPSFKRIANLRKLLTKFYGHFLCAQQVYAGILELMNDGSSGWLPREKNTRPVLAGRVSV